MVNISFQHALLESEANQIRASILDMAHCIRTFTDEVSEYSRKLVGIVQQIEGGEQIVEDGVGMAHTEHVRQVTGLLSLRLSSGAFCLTLTSFPLVRSQAPLRARAPVSEPTSRTSTRLCAGRKRWR